MDLEVPRNHVREGTETYLIPRLGSEYKVGKHFALWEFACHDGTPIVLVHPALLYFLDKMRQHLDAPVEVNSGFRTKAYNEKIGGATGSTHLYGMAADVVVDGYTPEEVADYAEEREVGGLGRYDDFTHIDVWKEDRRW